MGSTMKRTLALILALLVVLPLPTLVHAVSASTPILRPLPPDFSARKAVAYSPYRTAKNVADRDNETITPAMIQQDLDLLVTGGFTLIRLYDSSDKVARLTLQTIREHRLDIRVMLGIYIQHDNPTYNDAEIARGIALARDYKSIVAAVSVGNETMVNWSFNRIEAAAIKRFIDTVRNAVEQPVTTDDNWAFFAWNQRREQDPADVLASIDFVAMHTYPVLDSVYSPDLWDWRQAAVPEPQRARAMVDAAVARAKFEYAAVRLHMDSRGLNAMPIVIGETGWQADPAMVPFRSHPVNQKMYFDAMMAWQSAGDGPRTVFHFQAFDEPWKEADDKWGLFNVKRQARFVVQNLYPKAQWEPGRYAMWDAAYVKPIKVRRAITAKRYTLHASSSVPDEVRPDLTPWKAEADSIRLRGGQVIVIQPRPNLPAWVVRRMVPGNQADDLSAFVDGNLKFRIRATEADELEVGFDVGSATEGSAFTARMPLVDGQFGYRSNGAWCSVSIPVDAIRQFVAAKEKVGPSRIDLMRVTSPFVIAGKPAVPNALTTRLIEIESAYWSR